MKAIAAVSVMVVLLVMASGVAWADPIVVHRWSSGDGGNDHYYALTSSAGTWTSARQEAQNLGGELVTIGSAAENSFLVTTFLAGPDSLNAYWIGLTDAASEGSFAWVIAGEALSYTNWNTGNPNNWMGDEDYAVINWHRRHGRSDGVLGDWNDAPHAGINGSLDGPEFYRGIMEFTSNPVPEPGTLALFGLGAGGLAFVRRRARKKKTT